VTDEARNGSVRWSSQVDRTLPGDRSTPRKGIARGTGGDLRSALLSGHSSRGNVSVGIGLPVV